MLSIMNILIKFNKMFGGMSGLAEIALKFKHSKLKLTQKFLQTFAWKFISLFRLNRIIFKIILVF